MYLSTPAPSNVPPLLCPPGATQHYLQCRLHVLLCQQQLDKCTREGQAARRDRKQQCAQPPVHRVRGAWQGAGLLSMWAYAYATWRSSTARLPCSMVCRPMQNSTPAAHAGCAAMTVNAGASGVALTGLREAAEESELLA